MFEPPNTSYIRYEKSIFHAGHAKEEVTFRIYSEVFSEQNNKKCLDI